MGLLDHDTFINAFKRINLEPPLIDRDCFGTFPITNRGIQIWMLLRPHRDSDSVFKAYLAIPDLDCQ